jgi:hypothetical protein
MATLTKIQLNHAEQRIQEAKSAYVIKHTKVFGDEPKVTNLTDEEKYTLIENGKATLIRPVNDRYGYLTNAFKYPVSKASQTQQAARDKWQASVNTVKAKADKLERQLMDELIMSPDGAAALARIAAVFA